MYLIQEQKMQVQTLIDKIHMGIFENNTAASNMDHFELMVSNISGEFIDGQVIIGASSNARHTLINYDPLLDNSFNETYSNKLLQTEASSIIDFSESNPFGNI